MNFIHCHLVENTAGSSLLPLFDAKLHKIVASASCLLPLD
jgi:hypothetical protein